MNLMEKIRWYLRHRGLRALVLRAVEIALRVDRSSLHGGPAIPSQDAAASSRDASAGDGHDAPAIRATAFVEARHPALQPLPVYSTPRVGPRLNVVTDSIGPSSLFGGVGTALILSALLAEKNRVPLRIVTRTEPSDLGALAAVLRANGIHLTQPVEMAFCEVGNPQAQLDLGPDEHFLTTSWWTTASVLGSIPTERVSYLLQEDERMFYPHGDDWIRCNEILSRSDLRCVINTRLLHDHLRDSGLPDLPARAAWFEPAFPSAVYDPTTRAAGQRRRLFFYARPNNLRNLFLRGIEVLDAALREGVLDPAQWEIVFVGRDVPRIRLSGGVEPTVLPTMGWREYGAFISGVDLGVCLMATPHPSYPPLDLAAAGAAVLTNRFGAKQELSGYSRNIVMAGSSMPELLHGLREAVALACDDARRRRNRGNDGLQRDWAKALAPAVEFLG